LKTILLTIRRGAAVGRPHRTCPIRLCRL